MEDYAETLYIHMCIVERACLEIESNTYYMVKGVFLLNSAVLAGAALWLILAVQATSRM